MSLTSELNDPDSREFPRTVERGMAGRLQGVRTWLRRLR